MSEEKNRGRSIIYYPPAKKMLKKIFNEIEEGSLKYFNSVEEGLKNTKNSRFIGKSFYVIEEGKRVEYIFEGGIEDSNLVRVEASAGGEVDLSEFIDNDTIIIQNGKLKSTVTGGEVNIASISTTQTAEQLNALADGLYFANGAGVYNLLISNPTTGVTVANGKTTVESGYSVSFNKKGNVWSLVSSVSVSTYDDSNIISSLFRGEPFDTTTNQEWVNNGVVLAVRKLNNFTTSTDRIYITAISNRNNAAKIIQLRDQPNETGNLVAQWTENTTSYRTGKEWIEIKSTTIDLVNIKIYIDWDKLAKDTTQRRPLGVIVSKLYFTNDVDSFQRIENLEEKTKNVSLRELPLNVFGDILPPDFKKKMFSAEKDLEILLCGDSLTGLLSTCTTRSLEMSKISPPACNYNHWTSLLNDAIIRNRPIYNRFDTDIFNFTGTWSQQTGGKFNLPDWAGVHSVGDLSYQSNTNSASVSFVFDATKYEKLAVFHSKHNDGDDCLINVTEGNGKLLVSEDKTTWIEANGFNFTQKTNPDNLTDTQLKTQGIAIHQRNRILWFKRVVNTSVVNVKIEKKNTYASSFIYFLGTAFWNGNTIIVTNLGRGGRQTYLQRENISDIGDRKSDLVIYEMAVANEISIELSMINEWYDNFIYNKSGSNTRSLQALSNNFVDFQLIVLLPHGRNTYWDKNSAKDWTSTGVANDYLPYLKTRMIYQGVKNKNTFDNKIGFANMQDAFIQNGIFKGMTVEESLTASGYFGTTFTYDGVHFNDVGAIIYNKYLSAIFL